MKDDIKDVAVALRPTVILKDRFNYHAWLKALINLLESHKLWTLVQTYDVAPTDARVLKELATAQLCRAHPTLKVADITSEALEQQMLDVSEHLRARLAQARTLILTSVDEVNQSTVPKDATAKSLLKLFEGAHGVIYQADAKRVRDKWHAIVFEPSLETADVFKARFQQCQIDLAAA
ncbi:hypothetical protein HK101_010818, partial [Irineochytrium annulatum]